MLLELAVGDAYGAGFEYAPEMAQFNDLSGYVRHPRHRIIPGAYTDDTQMSLAIAEVIVSGEDWTPLNLANAFVTAFKRAPREGYAGGFYDFLCHVRDGAQFLAEIHGESDKSGAAMRAAPIGVFPTVTEVVKRTRIQAALTHNTPDGINAALAAALMSHHGLYRLGAKAGLGAFLEAHVPGDWSVPWTGKVKSKGWMSVRAAITALAASERMSELLRRCVDFTGDVDTVAAIALAAGSCCEEIEQDLPAHLVYGLEDSAFGRSYIEELDARLLSLVRR
ncbi:MAG TPA: ADP-ribosylglycohydrolase family protein [Ktedonobacterales bacterium]|jgi:ADP-ribosyl-[dinitrogen reductase] hydrolase|nr:ADP-ribosylglycohydrolase family protein [Ktedonobacterales bacterium]